ncbi:PaaI family thioesterase [Haloarcula marina]|uniref:PaaI family thioesterase n=1 Tax=Haloarcula marina TaxID=2961574 RepID=UPI0020B69F8B|nr:PaaI family thioesterase [Halomicroarcula marina]
MSLQALFNAIPFVEDLGMDITEVGDGHAVGRLPLRPEHSSNPHGRIAHGGVTYSLVDTVGGAAVVSLSGSISPTVDMRIDYLAPATDDLRAEANVVRDGGSVAVVDVEVYDAEDHHVASARGTYKTDGETGDSPWMDGVDAETAERLSD